MVIITNDLIERGRSKSGGWSKQQLEILGITWPPKKGWKKRIIGKHISRKKMDTFIKLKDEHL